MRQRNVAGRSAAQSEAAERSTKKNPASQDLSGRAVAILVGCVASLPLLVWLLLKLVLPEEKHAKLLQAPKRHRGLDADEVLQHLQNHTLLHVGGVHRSGTTLLWKGFALHQSVSKLEFQPGHDERHGHWIEKTMNEGIFLQGVYPRFGLDHQKFLLRKWIAQAVKRIPFVSGSLYPLVRIRDGLGRFALHPDHHLDESSRLVHKNSQVALFNQWSLFWDLSRPVLMEKSPSNCVISPFLHRLWGLGLAASPARFVFIQRHPIAVALATLRAGGATVNDLTVSDLVENWVAAEERRAKDIEQYFGLHEDPDAPAVHRTVTLEELAASPKPVLGDLLAWLGHPAENATLDAFEAMVTPNPNHKYFRVYCLKLIDHKQDFTKTHLQLMARFADRVLAVSPYDLHKVPDLCREVLLQDNATVLD